MEKAVNKLIEAAEKSDLFLNVLNTNGNIVVMRGIGEPKSPKILFIGEAPGKKENEEGVPFVGKSGVVLDRWIKEANIESYVIINTVPIIPLDEKGDIRPPTEEEVEYFKPYIEELIKAINPERIVCIGKTALSFFRIDIPNTTWQGNIGFIYHPAYFMRQGQTGDEDFKQLMSYVLKTNYIVNKQTADNLGHKEMISGVLAGIHIFAKEAHLFFKDINQKDECILGEYKVKVYTRDLYADEDMLVHDNYYQANPNIDIYLCCKIRTHEYQYLGYVKKELVDITRTIKMIGKESDGESKGIRRIFEYQYNPISDLIPIFELKKKEEKLSITHQNYIPLHLHSEFSIGDGFGTTEYIADSLYKKGFQGAVITDHGTIGGAWKFQKALLEKGLKPIIGCELYIKIPDVEKRAHMTILIKDKEGWDNFLKIYAIATREHFYYKPLVPLEVLLGNSKGLIVVSGCMDSPIMTAIQVGDIKLAESYIEKFKNTWGDDFYGEMQIHTIKNNQVVLQKAYELFAGHKVKCVITTDSHYPYKEDKELHEAVKAIGLRKKYGEAGFADDCFYLMTDQEMQERIQSNKLNNWLAVCIDSLKVNTLEIFNKVTFLIQSPTEREDTLPKVLPDKEDRRKLFQKLCLEGLAKLTPYKYEDIIKERLDLEVNRILDKEYENYFLMVWDMIKWAKENGIMVGPCRGSAGASLAAFCLNITEIDPIAFDLLFDRFISEIRKDAPDIDMDFQDDRRDELYTYLIDKYGRNHCAKIITYSRFHPKGIIRDIGRIFSIPIHEIEKICDLVIVRSGGDARSSFGLMDTFVEFEEAKKFEKKYPQATKLAIRLESHIRHRGLHAAAMIVSERDISTYIPIAKVSGEYVIEWEKQEAEDLQLIKFDILALKTLTVLAECAKDASVSMPKTFDDIEVYKNIFCEGKTLGVFQFESAGLSKLSKRLQIQDFNTLYDATTLYRPGSLHSGQLSVYVDRHLGNTPIEYDHPLLIDIAKSTKGIMLYQEQIMQVMYSVGGMSWATAEMCRKVMTKSKGKKAFEEYRREFISNANRIHKMEIRDAERLYDVVSTFGSYCVDGDTNIYRCSANQHTKQELTIKEAFKYQNSDNFKHRKLKIMAMDEYGYIKPHTIKKVIFTGRNTVFMIRTNTNRIIKATVNHRFIVNRDWKKLSEIQIGDLILVSNMQLKIKSRATGHGRGYSEICPRFKIGTGKTNDEARQKEKLMLKYDSKCQICKNPAFIMHHIDEDHNNNSDENTMLLCRKCHQAQSPSESYQRFKYGYPTIYETVIEIKEIGLRETYDIEMVSAPRNYVANGFVVHNSFNKAHAVGYSVISYQCAYYKYYYPAYFYKAVLKHETDEVQIANYIQEAKERKIDIEYPHINKSDYSYSIKDNKIYSGFNSIKGIGKSTAIKLIKYQPYNSFEDFLKRCKINKKALKGLAIADCFRDFKINKKVCSEKDIKEVTDYYDKQGDYSDLEYTQAIFENTNLRPSISILSTFNFGSYKFVDINKLTQEYSNKMGYIRGIVTIVINKDKLIRSDIRTHIHNFEPHMIYLNLNDGTGNLALQVSPWTYTKYKDMIPTLLNQPIIAYGKFAKDAQKMYVELLQIPNQTNDIDNFSNTLKNLNGCKAIVSASPAVSKKGKSYYRLMFNDGKEGLWFKLGNRAIYPGMRVTYTQSKEPFVDITLKKEV